MRLVLDTNIWLDRLVFGNPEVSALCSAARSADAAILIDAECLGELSRVLAYPEFALDATRIAGVLASVTGMARMFDRGAGVAAVTLPRCQDPDDQKFLRLAADCRAAWLITRDRALLKLGNRTRKAAGFAIGTPADWLASIQPTQVTASATAARSVR